LPPDRTSNGQFFKYLIKGDEVVRGNMGLKDQTMALRWIQSNIAFFGGKGNKET
jgi:bile salt-stimulated lipase